MQRSSQKANSNNNNNPEGHPLKSDHEGHNVLLSDLGVDSTASSNGRQLTNRSSRNNSTSGGYPLEVPQGAGLHGQRPEDLDTMRSNTQSVDLATPSSQASNNTQHSSATIVSAAPTSSSIPSNSSTVYLKSPDASTETYSPSHPLAQGNPSTSVSPSVSISPSVVQAVAAGGGETSMESRDGNESIHAMHVENTDSMVGGPTIGRSNNYQDDDVQSQFTDASDVAHVVAAQQPIQITNTNLERLTKQEASGPLGPGVGGAGAVSSTSTQATRAEKSLAVFRDHYTHLQKELGIQTSWALIQAETSAESRVAPPAHTATNNPRNTPSSSVNAPPGPPQLSGDSNADISAIALADLGPGALAARPDTGDVASLEHLPTIAGVTKGGFESVSKEMLIDYCWELHRAFARTLQGAQLLVSTPSGPTPSSSLPATGQSARISGLPESPAAAGLKPATTVQKDDDEGKWRPELHKAPGRVPTLEKTKEAAMKNQVQQPPSVTAGSTSQQPSRSPQPPSSRGPQPPKAGGPSQSRQQLTRLTSANTINTVASSIRSTNVAPAVVTSHIAPTERDMNSYGAMLNHYVLLEEIGRGCYGVVRQAFHQQARSLYAVKVLKRQPASQNYHPSYNQNGQHQNVPAQQARDEAIQREIAVMKKLRHKNIVALYEVVDDPRHNNLYLIMQYIDKGAVGSVGPNMLCSKTLDVKTMANYGRQICAGLQYLHNHNVVHRDIKPDNILKDSNDHVYLADFGVSESMMEDLSPQQQQSSNASEQSMTQKVKVSGRHGTPAFMAPELLTHDVNHRHDGKALDVWALGVTFYCFLCGELPFKSRREIVEIDPFFPDHVPFEWVALLQQLLQKNPKERPIIPEVRKAVKVIQETYTKEEEAEAEVEGVTEDVDVDAAEVASAFTPCLDSTYNSQASSALSNARYSSRQTTPTGSVGGRTSTHSSVRVTAGKRGPSVTASKPQPKPTTVTAGQATMKQLPLPIGSTQQQQQQPASSSATGTTQQQSNSSSSNVTKKRSLSKATPREGSQTARGTSSKTPREASPRATKPPAPAGEAPEVIHTARGAPASAGAASYDGSGSGNSGVPTLPPMSSENSNATQGGRSSTGLSSSGTNESMPGMNPAIQTARQQSTSAGSSSQSGTFYANPNAQGMGASFNSRQQLAVLQPGATMPDGAPVVQYSYAYPNGKKWHPGVKLPEIAAVEKKEKPWRKPAVEPKKAFK